MNFKEKEHVLVTLVRLYRLPDYFITITALAEALGLSDEEISVDLDIRGKRFVVGATKGGKGIQLFQAIAELQDQGLVESTKVSDERAEILRPTAQGVSYGEYLQLSWLGKRFQDLKGDIRTIIVAALTVAAIKVIEWITALVGLTR